VQVKCPQCGAAVAWKTTPTRPFCSERCQLIDLGAWVDQRYVIPGGVDDDSVTTDRDPDDDSSGA
jgi:uncharacterized protein